MEFLELDLSDMKSCVLAAKHFAGSEERLDVLIANAALSVVVSNFHKVLNEI
jgi:NAD(P)-dependent dehydrogenase (short-subunit alcohol dehydrogenase family)